jgi:hypothetical protein
MMIPNPAGGKDVPDRRSRHSSIRVRQRIM